MNIQYNYSEIHAQEIARAYAHLTLIVDLLDPVYLSLPKAALLIGRDVLHAHKVREQLEDPGMHHMHKVLISAG